MKYFSKKPRLYYIWVLLVSFVINGVCGCAGTQQESVQVTGIEELEKEIELLDPVGVSTNYDVAGYRDIYNAEVYSCVCCPAVTEFAYSTEVPFAEYGKLPGEEIAAGEVLVYGDTVNLDEEYHLLMEEMEDKAEDYEDEMSDLLEDLYDAKQNEYKAGEPYMEGINRMPEEGSAGYDMWARGSMPAEGAYKAAVLSREKVEQSIIEKEELFALEQEYNMGRLERLENTISEARVTANTDGTVVAINPYTFGDVIQKNANVAAVGDMSNKILHTEYVSKAKIDAAEDVYACIDGKRYEAIYEVMEKDEYSGLKAANDVVYSTFYLEDPNDEIPMGKFATLVIVEEIRKNTLAVSADALYRKGKDYYCYLFDGESSVMTPVTVGLTDGMYTEVLSGIKEGDRVLVAEPVNAKGKMQTLEYGAVASVYADTGTLYYPRAEWIVNPARVGTFYISEICVEQFEQVEAGQMLAKIEVIPDEISIGRVERKIQRQQERLSKLLEKKRKIYSDEIDRSLERAIEARQKAIEDLSEELSELTEYSGEIVLTASYAGIVTEVADLEKGDMISFNQRLLQVADRTLCYVLAEDAEGQLSYGNEATITYIGEGNVKKEIKGTVVSVNEVALSKQLKTGYALILISEEDIRELAEYGSTVNAGGGWNRNRFEVTAQIRSVDNVLLVPKNAVTVYNQNTFVKVKKQDGSFTYVSFISGGADRDNYWVIEGLNEGMEICLE